MEKEFLKTPYYGADGEDFREEFISYLDQIIATRRWDAMSDHALYLQGAKRAIEEIIAEIKDV